MELFILYFKGLQVKILKNDVFLFLKIDIVLTNSADPDKILPYAAFHLGLHCLPNYLFTRDQGTAGSSLTGVTVLWSLSKTHLS